MKTLAFGLLVSISLLSTYSFSFFGGSSDVPTTFDKTIYISGSNWNDTERKFYDAVNTLVKHQLNIIIFSFYWKTPDIELGHQLKDTYSPDDVWDAVRVFHQLPENERQGIIETIHAVPRGKLIMSIGGSTYRDWKLLSDDGIRTYIANAIGYAIKAKYDGIDLDLEGGSTEETINFMITAVHYARTLPKSLGFYSVAPEIAHFESAKACEFFIVNPATTRPFIDRVFIQYYNDKGHVSDDPKNPYDPTETGILVKSLTAGTSVEDMIAKCKLTETQLSAWAFGRPIRPGNVSHTDGSANETGTFDLKKIHDVFCKANKKYGTGGGLMFWKFMDDQGDNDRLTSLDAITNTCDGLRNIPPP